MESILQFWTWLQQNYFNIVALVTAMITLAEAVVRLTPTEKDDGAVQRAGEAIKKFLDLIKVPNASKKPGTEEKKP